ncbi:MAG TPA: hypothetical protein DEP87_02235, partial [Candidatus Pacebacteria bacterium]|nr:hypothetical protein [Candidatus Paceibacterota bacterium]
PVTNAYSEGSDDAYGAVTNTELFVSNMIGAITILGGLFFLLFFFLGAFSWISAAGDKGKVDKAREQMTQGAVGMIIMIAAYGAIGLVGSIIGYDLLNPGAQFLKLVPGYSP